MSAAGARASARRDAAEAVHALADAGRIVTGSAVATLSDSVSGLAGSLSGRVDDARHALAEAVDPAPVRVRRAPWIVAVLVLSGVAAYGWAALLRRERPADPGTPASTEPPLDDRTHGVPAGRPAGTP